MVIQPITAAVAINKLGRGTVPLQMSYTVPEGSFSPLGSCVADPFKIVVRLSVCLFVCPFVCPDFSVKSSPAYGPYTRAKAQKSKSPKIQNVFRYLAIVTTSSLFEEKNVSRSKYDPKKEIFTIGSIHTV